MTTLRVLMPQRFDVLSRAMDTNVVAQWHFLAEACDLVLWGPGLSGYVPGRPLDQVAEDVDADVVLLPDFHHAIPGLWDELWAGAERCRRPVVWHLTDWGSAIEQRREVWRRIRPAAVLINNVESRLVDYADLRQELGTQVLSVQWGFDRALFHPPADDAPARDIDLLVCGADQPESVYPARGAVKRAARALADRWRVVDLSHPGYWEWTGVAAGRGQAQFADLLRRTRLVTTGTAFGSLPRKYLEAAACGAVGVGDLPLDEPEADRLAEVMLAVDPDWPEERMTAEMDALLRDAERLRSLAARGPHAVAHLDHRERAHAYTEALASVASGERRERRPRPFPAAAPAVLAVAAPEPPEVPSTRTDWHDVWRFGTAGASRTRRLEALLADEETDVCVVALDPDAARDVDALVLAEACRANGAIAVRPAGEVAAGSDPRLASWALVAAPRELLLEELGERHGRTGIEQALIALGDRVGWNLGPGGAFSDVASELTRLHAAHVSGTPIDHLLPQAVAAHHRSLREGRLRTARELAGWLGASAGVTLDRPAAPGTAGPAQDPELDEARAAQQVALYDPADPLTSAAIAAHATRGHGAPELLIALPVAGGLSPEAALPILAADLEAAGVDLDHCADLVLLERPLWDAELAWLAERRVTGAASPAESRL